uniref:Uncharacterized protein n=1 Tax=Glossina brevipalpis TaxID=37001 RepID=A0A1A9VZU1_9MUSC
MKLGFYVLSFLLAPLQLFISSIFSNIELAFAYGMNNAHATEKLFPSSVLLFESPQEKLTRHVYDAKEEFSQLKCEITSTYATTVELTSNVCTGLVYTFTVLFIKRYSCRREKENFIMILISLPRRSKELN